MRQPTTGIPATLIEGIQMALRQQTFFRKIGTPAVEVLFNARPRWLTASEIIEVMAAEKVLSHQLLGRALREAFEHCIESKYHSKENVYRYRFK